ncbi:hypothetical protein ACX9I7_26410 [Streptomyces sp. L500]
MTGWLVIVGSLPSGALELPLFALVGAGVLAPHAGELLLTGTDGTKPLMSDHPPHDPTSADTPEPVRREGQPAAP